MLVPVQPESAKPTAKTAKPAKGDEVRWAAMTGSLQLKPILRANCGQRKPPRGAPAPQTGRPGRFYG